jgi:hypothetical protein
MDKEIESTAYHEAAHVVAAVAQGMPIRPAGIDLDLCGNGCAYYFQRVVGDLASSPKDEKERKRTAIALYAAHSAQRKFYLKCQDRGWTNDLYQINALVREMYPEESEAQVVQSGLQNEATNLVDQHWPEIEELAKSALSRPLSPLLAEDTRWGAGPYKRNLPAAEIAGLLAKYNLEVILLPEDVKTYDPT